MVARARISGIIDFGDLPAGDPATDLSVAWMLFTPAARTVFRAAAGGSDDNTWRRARGWTLALGIAHLANSADTPEFAALGRHVLDCALRDD